MEILSLRGYIMRMELSSMELCQGHHNKMVQHNEWTEHWLKRLGACGYMRVFRSSFGQRQSTQQLNWSMVDYQYHWHTENHKNFGVGKRLVFLILRNLVVSHMCILVIKVNKLNSKSLKSTFIGYVGDDFGYKFWDY